MVNFNPPQARRRIETIAIHLLFNPPQAVRGIETSRSAIASIKKLESFNPPQAVRGIETSTTIEPQSKSIFQPASSCEGY